MTRRSWIKLQSGNGIKYMGWSVNLYCWVEFFFFLNRGFESPLSFFWALLWGKICVDLRWFLMQRIERSYYWKCWWCLLWWQLWWLKILFFFVSCRQGRRRRFRFWKIGKHFENLKKNNFWLSEDVAIRYLSVDPIGQIAYRFKWPVLTRKFLRAN